MMEKEGAKTAHPGAMRIMNCFGHNAPINPDGSLKPMTPQAGKRPLYLLLENCGGDDLTKFMARMAGKGELSSSMVRNLYKQLLEGLAFLRNLPQPWIHHDLKPDNIAVKTQKDGTFSLHLIDFGAAVPAVRSKQSKI